MSVRQTQGLLGAEGHRCVEVLSPVASGGVKWFERHLRQKSLALGAGVAGAIVRDDRLHAGALGAARARQ